MAGFNKPTGFGRTGINPAAGPISPSTIPGNTPTGFNPAPATPQADPAIEALKQALAGKNAGSRAEMLERRANIVSPGKSSLFTGPFDAWLAQNEREKQQEALVEAKTAEEAKVQAQRKQQAVAAAQMMKASGANQDMQDAAYLAVMSGMDMPEIPKPDPHAGFDVRDKIYDDSKDALKGIYETQTSMEILNQMVEKGYDSGVAQIGAMYAFIKGIDPDSVVRPSETDLVGLAESYIQQMQNIVTRVETGVVSSEAVFNDLVELTGKLNDVQISGARRAMDDHIGRANVEGYEAERIWGQPFADRYKLGPTQADVPKKGEPKVATPIPETDAQNLILEAQALIDGAT